MAALLASCTEKPSEPVGPASTSASPSAPPAHEAGGPRLPQGVPALLPGETPPVKGPDYFDPREMSAGGLVHAFESCRASSQLKDPTAPVERIAPYCACVVDAWRANIRATGDADTASQPAKPQLDACSAAVAAGKPSPFALPPPKDTPSIYKAWTGCLDAFPTLDHGAYCSCYVDAAFQPASARGVTVRDSERCELADRYWDTTHQHLTLRQFEGLSVSDSGAPATPIAPASRRIR